MNTNNVLGNGSSDLHQPVDTRSSPQQTHRHTCRAHTHAGLFLGRLPSSAELPAEFLVQTEVLPLSPNSNAGVHEKALTAVK